MTPEQRWDGPIQEEIRKHDAALGHHRVQEVEWFKRFPAGGTVFLRPPTVTAELPNGEEPADD